MILVRSVSRCNWCGTSSVQLLVSILKHFEKSRKFFNRNVSPQGGLNSNFGQMLKQVNPLNLGCGKKNLTNWIDSWMDKPWSCRFSISLMNGVSHWKTVKRRCMRKTYKDVSCYRVWIFRFVCDKEDISLYNLGYVYKAIASELLFSTFLKL